MTSTRLTIAAGDSGALIPVDSPIAWARDASTGELKYILELGREKSGFKCGCVCLGCGARLQAVNAGKQAFIKRPHFRHDKAHLRTSCQILTARQALATMLGAQGEIVLPRRSFTTSIQGLSGQYHQAWVERPAQRVRIVEYAFRDELQLKLSLEGGREVLVRLVGSAEMAPAETEAQSLAIPTILVLVDDPEIALLPPKRLRELLDTAVAEGHWCSHWEDDALKAEATAKALAEARALLDWSDDEDDQITDAEYRQESYLHKLAKDVLSAAGRIRVPQLLTEWGSHQRDEAIFVLRNVRQEHSIGSIRPDLLADFESDATWGSGQVMIEICVTHKVNEEKLQKLRALKIPVLEVDFSITGGKLSAQDFEHFLIEETAHKQWVFHPDSHRQAKQPTTAVSSNKPELTEEELLAKYIEIFLEYAKLWRLEELSDEQRILERQENQRLEEYAKQLAWYGYRHMADYDFRGIVRRILSIRLGQAIGYRLDTAWQVINTMFQDQTPSRNWHTFYLIAINVYQPQLPPKGIARVQQWRSDVIASLKRGDATYRRADKYDKSISKLFPEMAGDIAKPLPLPTPRPEEVWLKGRALDEWVRNNPEAAKAWFESQRNRK